MMLVVYLRVFFLQLPNLGFSQHQISLITQSKEAYETFKNDDSAHKRTERAQESFIVTESESENSVHVRGLPYGIILIPIGPRHFTRSLQLKDGRDICLINQDDASGFQLDTLTTCKQYAMPTLEGRQVLTTRTDYVNKYPSTLQTTSYNFTSTLTTEEVCVGVVKVPSCIHPKNPCQHSVDL